MKLDDQLVRDGKFDPLAGNAVIPMFGGLVVLGVPTWLLVLLPTAIITQISRGLFSLFGVTRTRLNRAIEPIPEIPAMVSSDIKSRNLDLVLFGATGFTGQLASSYLAKKYGRTVKWAIAGRRQDALESQRRVLGPDFHDLPIIIADSSDPSSLKTLARSTRVVITTAGPFELHGTALLAACAEYGTHYCDITGEVDWVRDMVERYDALARKSGAKIVHFCGNDSVPWDLSVLALAKELARRGDSLAEASCFTEAIGGGISGGTLASVLRAIDNPKPRTATADPLLRTAAGAPSAARVRPQLPLLPYYAKDVGRWAGFFVMAPVNLACVRRSLALGAYPGASTGLVYRDAITAPSLAAALVQLGGLVWIATALISAPARWALFRAGVLPRPGQGPSAEAMNRGYLRVTTVGRSAGGKQARGVLYFPNETGYKDTARMLAESGLLLALEPQRAAASGGGVLTPAAGLGEALLERLVATGCSWRVE